MPRDEKVLIAGKPYRLRYLLPVRDEIEERCSGTGEHRALLNIIYSGKLRDQATVVWGGIRGADRDAKVTPRGLIELFQTHNDKGGDYYQQIYCPAAILAAESKLCGDVDIAEMKRQLAYKDPEGKEQADPPATVKAAE
jgi:hypothetical protein